MCPQCRYLSTAMGSMWVGIRHHPDATLVVVTPGQQAPLGALSLQRRLQLLDWAAEKRVWIIEDDYLSELQFDGRAAPALACSIASAA